MRMQIVICSTLAALLVTACGAGGPEAIPATPVAATATAVAQQPLAALPTTLELELYADGFDNPLHLTGAGDGSGRLFVVEKAGRIRIIRDGGVVAQPFLDITDRVSARANEQGLLSVAFHPRFADTGLVYVNYTNRADDTVISRFRATGDTADPASETILLQFAQPFANHNGGLIKFGPDGYLYIGTGDGGSGGDPRGFGQRLDTLLGKMLRIDVDGGDPYAIPPDNLQRDSAVLPEIWAYGLRNPWRFSFDRATGDLYIADVGQNRIEEIHFTPAGSSAGINYGWNILEGSSCFRAGCDTSGLELPIAEYDHSVGCSVTGGYVYRGSMYEAVAGTYIFADFCSGRIWALHGSGPVRDMIELLNSGKNISSFGEDDAGELYLTSMYEGRVYRLVLQ